MSPLYPDWPAFLKASPESTGQHKSEACWITTDTKPTFPAQLLNIKIFEIILLWSINRKLNMFTELAELVSSHKKSEDNNIWTYLELSVQQISNNNAGKNSMSRNSHSGDDVWWIAADNQHTSNRWTTHFLENTNSVLAPHWASCGSTWLLPKQWKNAIIEQSSEFMLYMEQMTIWRIISQLTTAWAASRLNWCSAADSL